MTAPVWHRVAELGELPDGRVKTVSVGHRTLALTRVGDHAGPSVVHVVTDPLLV